MKIFMMMIIVVAAVVGSIEACESPLGLSNGKIKDSQLSASSSHEPNTVGAKNGRVRVEEGGGAWCPGSLIDPEAQEYIEVDLEADHRIVGVLTQGRYGNGHGQEFAQFYKVQYWRRGMRNFTAVDFLFDGNSNTYSVAERKLPAPVVASKVRVFPYSKHPRTVCMRIELLGCVYEDGVESYSTPEAYRGDEITTSLIDDTFDGQLGQLVDGVIGDEGLFAYVGWKNESLRPIDLNFFFDAERTFSSVTVFAHLPSSTYGLDLGFPAEIGLQCSSSGDDKILFTVDRNSAARKIQLMLKRDSCLGDRIRLSFRHSGKWMAISEVKFDSEPYDPRKEIPVKKHHEDIIVDLSPKTGTTEKVPISTTTTTKSLNNLMKTPPATSSPTPPTSWWTESNGGGLGVAIGVLATVVTVLVVLVSLAVYRSRSARNRTTLPYECGRRLFPSSSSSASSTSSSSSPSPRPKQKKTATTTDEEANNVYSEPIFHLSSNKRNGSSTLTASGRFAATTSSEYASPLLLYSNCPSTPPLHHQNHHHNHHPQSLKREQNVHAWQDFYFPGPPSGPPPPPVQCYASTDIFSRQPLNGDGSLFE